MERDLSKYPVFLRRILRSEDCVIGFWGMWAIGLIIFPLGAFYFGTIAASKHIFDLTVIEIRVGEQYALGGLALGLILGLWATFVYPVLKEREDAIESVRHDTAHHELTHGEEIATDIGQKPEHKPGH